MLSHELANKLKDAGFPKEGFIVCDGKNCNMKKEIKLPKAKMSVGWINFCKLVEQLKP